MVVISLFPIQGGVSHGWFSSTRDGCDGLIGGACSRLLLAYEFRQKSSPYGQIPGLVGDEDNWHSVDAVLLLNSQTTLAVGWVPLGTLANTDENGGWCLQFKHEF